MNFIKNYGLEMIHTNKTELKRFDRIQANLVKIYIELSKYSRSTVWLNALDIDTITKLYYKHKIMFLQLSQQLYVYLKHCYQKFPINRCSFISQVAKLDILIESGIQNIDTKDSFELLNKCLNMKLVNYDTEEIFRKIIDLCKFISRDKETLYFIKNFLNNVLDYMTLK